MKKTGIVLLSLSIVCANICVADDAGTTNANTAGSASMPGQGPGLGQGSGSRDPGLGQAPGSQDPRFVRGPGGVLIPVPKSGSQGPGQGQLGAQGQVPGKGLAPGQGITPGTAPATEAQLAAKDPIAAQNLAKGEAFLNLRKYVSGVTTLPDGLEYKVFKNGSGPIPTDADTVILNYEGSLIDGTVFDSTYARGQPAAFRMSEVIPGWAEVLKLMPVGSIWGIVVPAKLAYGMEGMPPVIGPEEVLVFKLELMSIGK